MLSQYYEDKQGPVCTIEDCVKCTKDCREVYIQVARDYDECDKKFGIERGKMGKRIIPKVTLAELRETNADGAKVMDGLIKMFHGDMIKDPHAIESGIQQIGLEGSLEAFEELIEKGYLRITMDEETETFGLMVWDIFKEEYRPA